MKPEESIYVGCPNIGNREALLARINEMLYRRRFSNNGPLVQDFEKRVSDFLGVKHVVAMCNATVALEIASRALNLHGEVIVPSYTFIATAHALQWQEITPVFVIWTPQLTISIRPRSSGSSRRRRREFSGCMCGGGMRYGSDREIAARRNLKVMYDASHGFACSKGGRMLGTFGECEVFSFHATKFLNCFEGGAVVTNNNDLAEKCV